MFAKREGILENEAAGREMWARPRTESRHGFRVERLLREAAAFFVMRYDRIPAGCGGIELFDTAYGEIKRMADQTSRAHGGAAVATAPRLSTSETHRRSTVAQITMTQAEVAALREVLTSYLSDLRMEIADTDSMQFREDLKRQEELLKNLLQRLDTAVASPDTSS
jgi:hypothetical protein